MYTKTEGIMLSFCTKDGEDHLVTIGFEIVPRENKHYWQQFMNAVFHFIHKHDMIMSDKTEGEIMNRSLHCLICIIVLRNFTLGLEGIRHLIVKVAADIKAKQC